MYLWYVSPNPGRRQAVKDQAPVDDFLRQPTPIILAVIQAYWAGSYLGDRTKSTCPRTALGTRT